MFTGLFMSTYGYSFLPKFTRVYLCLTLFTSASLHLLTPVYSCLPMFSRFFLLFTTIKSFMFTYYYPCLLVFSYV